MKFNRKYLLLFLKKFLIYAIAVLFLIVMLLFLQNHYGNIFFPKPLDVLERIAETIKDASFFKESFWTLKRTVVSYIITIFISVVLSFASFRFKAISNINSVFLSIVRTTPLASLILILFLFLATDKIPQTSAFLMAFPLAYSFLLRAISDFNDKYKETVRLYKIKTSSYFFIVLLGISKDILAISQRIVPLILKVVISSEIMLYIQSFGIGKKIASASLSIDTTGIFAWTIIAIFFSSVFEFLFSRLNRIFKIL